MAGQSGIIWLDGKANVLGNVEKIYPGVHVKQNEWQPEWNNMYLPPNGSGHCYDYILDYECIFNHPMNHIDNQHLQDDQKRWQNLQDAKNQGTPVQITDLAHFTNENAAEQIVNSNGFRGGLKKINEDERHDDVNANLSWWSPIITDEEKTNLREHLGEVIQPFADEENDDLDDLKNQFATSDAFQPNRFRYGKHLFQYGINTLCQHHSQLIGGEPQYKILGTFGYKKEVMHVVLVCSKADGTGQFAGYPDVLSPKEDVDNEAVITRDDNDNWVWRPQATGGGKILRLQAHLQKYPLHRRWEHVAFAFHILDHEIMMRASLSKNRKIIDQYGNIVDLPKNDDDDDVW